MIEFTVLGDPTPQGSMRGFTRPGGHVGMTPSNEKQLRIYRGLIAESALGAMRASLSIPMSGSVCVQAGFFFPRPQIHYGTGRNSGKLKDWAPRHVDKRPDVDKCLRALLDGMAGIVYVQDSQVARVIVEKLYVGEGQPPRTEVKVWLIDEGRAA